MAYPIFACGQSEHSAEKTLDDLQIDRATNGAPRGRALYSAPKKTFSVHHQFATVAEKAALEAFYLAHRLAAFDFVWHADGVTYSCHFAGAPDYQSGEGGYWGITCSLVQR